MLRDFDDMYSASVAVDSSHTPATLLLALNSSSVFTSVHMRVIRVIYRSYMISRLRLFAD